MMREGYVYKVVIELAVNCRVRLHTITVSSQMKDNLYFVSRQ